MFFSFLPFTNKQCKETFVSVLSTNDTYLLTYLQQYGLGWNFHGWYPESLLILSTPTRLRSRGRGQVLDSLTTLMPFDLKSDIIWHSSTSRGKKILLEVTSLFFHILTQFDAVDCSIWSKIIRRNWSESNCDSDEHGDSVWPGLRTVKWVTVVVDTVRHGEYTYIKPLYKLPPALIFLRGPLRSN